MRKIFLICPAETSQMPYLNSYLKILDQLELDYEYIIWDRKGNMPIESKGHIFKDSKSSLRRGFFDYLKFAFFYKKVISKYNDCLVFAFGIPVLFFMNKKFIKKNNVIADIRDHHLLFYLNPFFKRILHSTRLNVLSSPAFNNWLPKNTKYVVNHNTSFSKSGLKKVSRRDFKDDLVSISCIGALKDFTVLRELLEEANARKFNGVKFCFHGEGVINSKLELLKINCSSTNIEITGKYHKIDEQRLYCNSDWINMFMSDSSINNKTCLSNRLYNSAFHGKPLLCYEGSYISELVRTYNLGIVFSDVNDFFESFHIKSSEFDYEKYNVGRFDFFNFVDCDNEIFSNRLKSLLVGF